MKNLQQRVILFVYFPVSFLHAQPFSHEYAFLMFLGDFSSVMMEFYFQYLLKLIYLYIFAEEPEIFLDLGTQDLLSCRAGTTIKIPAIIKGRPVPKTFWEYEGKAKTAAKVSKSSKVFFLHLFLDI